MQSRAAGWLIRTMVDSLLIASAGCTEHAPTAPTPDAQTTPAPEPASVQQAPTEEPSAPPAETTSAPCVMRTTPVLALLLRRNSLPIHAPGPKYEAGELVSDVAHCTAKDCRLLAAPEMAALVESVTPAVRAPIRTLPRSASPHYVRRTIQIRWADHTCIVEDGTRKKPTTKPHQAAFSDAFRLINDTFQRSPPARE